MGACLSLGALKKLIVGPEVTEIEEWAFEGYIYLKEVDMGGSRVAQNHRGECFYGLQSSFNNQVVSQSQDYWILGLLQVYKSEGG